MGTWTHSVARNRKQTTKSTSETNAAKDDNDDKEMTKKWNDEEEKNIDQWNKKYRIEIGNREEIERRKKSKSESGGEVGANCTIGTKVLLKKARVFFGGLQCSMFLFFRLKFAIKQKQKLAWN